MRTSYYEKIKRYFEFILILVINVSSKKEKIIIIRDDAKGYFFAKMIRKIVVLTLTILKGHYDY